MDKTSKEQYMKTLRERYFAGNKKSISKIKINRKLAIVWCHII